MAKRVKKVLLRGLFFLFAVCFGCAFLSIMTACATDGNSASESVVDSAGGKSAQDYSEGLRYVLSDDEKSYILVDYGTCTDTDIIVPSTYQGLPVTAIGEEAFNYNWWITDLSEEAIEKYKKITSITIPDSITSVGFQAFRCCENLQYNEYDNGYYLGSKRNPYFVFMRVKDSSIETCIIHKDTKLIGDAAFAGCEELTEVKIPDGVTQIGEITFQGCSSLTKVEIPEGVTSIGYEVFMWCEKLKDIKIPDSVTDIGIYAFEGCSSLTSVNLKNRQPLKAAAKINAI